MRKFALSLGLSVALFPAFAFAHGAWIAPRTGELAVIYGHGAEDDAYKPEKVKSVTGITAAGEKRDVKVIAREKNVVLDVPADVVAISTFFDNGFWTKGPDGKWQNVSKKDVPGATESGHYVKYSTHVHAKLGGALKPFGTPLEIVSLEDPISLKPGDDLELQILLDGKPLAGVTLIPDYINHSHDETTTKTDADGKISIPVANDGLNVIGISHDFKTPSNADADEMGYFATLSFMLPHEE